MTSDPPVLRLQRVLEAPPERIFAAWTDPAVLLRWWAAEPGWSTADATTDVRVGGGYRLSMRDTAGGVRSVSGEYLEVDPPHRLVYTWAWESATDRAATRDVTVVTVEFVAEGTRTRVLLEQRGFADDAERDSHDHGWQGCLDNLERRVIGKGGAQS